MDCQAAKKNVKQQSSLFWMIAKLLWAGNCSEYSRI